MRPPQRRSLAPSSNSHDSRRHDEAAENPHRRKHSLQEPGPIMERRTGVNGEKADNDEQDQDDYARAEDIRRQAMPAGVRCHSAREHDQPGASTKEGEHGGKSMR